MNQPEKQIPKILNIPDQYNPNKPKKKADERVKKDLVKSFLRNIGRGKVNNIPLAISEFKQKNNIDESIWNKATKEAIQGIKQDQNYQSLGVDIDGAILVSDEEYGLEIIFKAGQELFNQENTELIKEIRPNW